MLPKAPRQYRALALTYLHVLYIDGETLNGIAHGFPSSRRSLKTWCAATHEVLRSLHIPAQVAPKPV